MIINTMSFEMLFKETIYLITSSEIDYSNNMFEKHIKQSIFSGSPGDREGSRNLTTTLPVRVGEAA